MSGGNSSATATASPGHSASPWHSAAALVFVDDIDTPRLDPADAHHLSRVLRIRAGSTICLSDGDGSWRTGDFDGSSALDRMSEPATESRPSTPLTVGLALVKGEKPELVVQKLTEIGIDRIVFFESRRSVARWKGDKAERNVDRLARVAASASSQSRRLFIPTVEFADLAVLLESGAVVADFGGRKLGPDDSTVLIGPEGGWEPGEYGSAPTVHLGSNVLRAETAAISAAVRMCSMTR